MSFTQNEWNLRGTYKQFSLYIKLEQPIPSVVYCKLQRVLEQLKITQR